MSSASQHDASCLDASLGEKLERAADRLRRSTPPQCEYEDADADLEPLLPVMRMLGALGESIVESAGRSNTVPDFAFEVTGTELGDFQILREIGRGGMGVVYEAQQRSLNRRVALKVLPFASMLDERQRRRFENEARAAASLEHPNIVPVYAVGCERDVHYYAMRLIEGKSLADFMKQKCVRCVQLNKFNSADLFCSRDCEKTDGDCSTADDCNGLIPEWPIVTSKTYIRTVVEIVAQAADGLDHAHALGVVHRDVKPSNLLVTKEGHVWLTDFGLAQTMTDRTLTLSGDIVGTMRYMSPEQANARPVVDFRTDIYSLGVTLYELLTLQPAFTADNPQRLLRDVISLRVSPPSTLNRAVPRDLDNIVLKAVADNPDERYEAARDLGDDLRRFLDGQSVLARSPTWIDQTRKLMRRHAGVVWSILLALTLTVLLLAGSVILISRERAAAQIAAEEARQSARLASRNQVATEREYRRAESNLRDAHAAVDRMFLHADQQLAEFPNSDRIRHDLLEDSLQFYVKLLNQKPTDEIACFDLAVAFDRVGEINHRLGRTSEARSACLSGQKLFGELVEMAPAEPKYQLGLAKSYADLAALDLGLSGRREQVEGLLQAQVDIVSQLVAEQPDEIAYRFRLAEAFTRHADVLAGMGRLAEAEADYRQAERIWKQTEEASADLAYVLGYSKTERGWAALCARTHQLQLAKGRLEGAESLIRRSSSHERTQLKIELVRVEQQLAEILARLGDTTTAEPRLATAIAISQSLVDAFPDAVDFQYQLAVCEFNRYRLLGMVDRHDAAHEALLDSTRRLEQIVGETGGEMPHCIDLARNYCEVGMWFQRQQQTEIAEEYSRRSRQLRERCLEQFPLAADPYHSLSWYLSMCPMLEQHETDLAIQLARRALEYEPENGSHWQVLGVAYYRDGQWQECLEAFEKAIEQNQSVSGLDALMLASAHAGVGHAETATQWFERAQRSKASHCWNQHLLQRLQAEASQLIASQL